VENLVPPALFVAALGVSELVGVLLSISLSIALSVITSVAHKPVIRRPRG
jgi:hypothetical protein